MIEGLVFDLDDTLSWERDYVRSGFDSIGRVAGRSPAESRDITLWLWSAFESGIRSNTFDLLLDAMPSVADRFSVDRLVEVYRSHVPRIGLIPGMAASLGALSRSGLRLGVLTDGPEASQRAKVEALALAEIFDPIVITAAHPQGFSKPGVSGFRSIAEAWSMPGHALAYVADNPAKDFIGPRRLGWTTIRLRAPSQLRFGLEPVDPGQRPDFEIGAPEELIDIVLRGRPPS